MSNRHPTELSEVGWTNEKLIDELQCNLATTICPAVQSFSSSVNRLNDNKVKLGGSLDDGTEGQTIEKVRKLTEEKWLWTGDSVYCIYTHHVEDHCTIRDKCDFVVTIHCHGNNELCSCEHFRRQRLRIAIEEEVI